MAFRDGNTKKKNASKLIWQRWDRKADFIFLETQDGQPTNVYGVANGELFDIDGSENRGLIKRRCNWTA